MNLPGFTATASLNSVNQRYGMGQINFAVAGGEGVVPQLGTTMEDWWNQWVLGEGGGGGGGGTLSPCELAATQTKDQCLAFCNFFGGSKVCRDNCWNNYVRDFANCG